MSTFLEMQQFCLEITFAEQDLLQPFVSAKLPEHPCHFSSERKSGGVAGGRGGRQSRIGSLDATPRASENIELPACVEAQIEQAEILLIRKARKDILLSTGSESRV